MNSTSIYTQVWDDEMTDKETGHKIVTIGTDIYELKYCNRCKKWLPLEMFRRSKNYPDDHLPHCQSCAHKRAPRVSKRTPIRTITQEDLARHKVLETIDDAVKTLVGEITTLNNRIKEMEKERKDLDHLTEREIEHILMVHRVPPRIHFNAINKHYPQYHFFCKDEATGITTSIRTEVA